MMRVEVASNLQSNPNYGENRAATARMSEKRDQANAGAWMTEVANNNSALGAASGELASIKEVAALLQSTISGESGEMADDLADSENLKEVISMLNELSHLSESRLEFEFDQEEDISVIRVVDSDTGELIRQIPPEKLLATMDHVFDTLGIVFDQTA